MTSPRPTPPGEPPAADAAYRERDQLVAALSKLFPSHLTWQHEPDGEDGWRNIVCIHLPTSQVTWHIPDHERWEFFEHLLMAPNHWDGHDTAEKYRRLNALVPVVVAGGGGTENGDQT